MDSGWIALAQASVADGSGTAEFWAFWIVAPLVLGAAIAMVAMRNPVHGALMLVANFMGIAVLYAVLQAQFLAVIQVIVYAGAIMVLFLFVLMLLGIDTKGDRVGTRLRGQRPAAIVLGAVLFAGLAVGVAGPYLGTDSSCADTAAVRAARAAQGPHAQPCAGVPVPAEGGNVRQVGGLLFTDYVWPFEVTSVLLVIAAIGAMVLGRRREDPADLVEQPRSVPAPAAVEDAGPAPPTPALVGADEAGADAVAGATDHPSRREEPS